MPFRRVRPWRERPPTFDAWRGIEEGWDVHLHPTLRRGSLRSSNPLREGRRAVFRGRLG